MSWLNRLEKVFAVRLRGTLFKPSERLDPFEKALMEATQETLVYARCHAELHEKIGKSFAFHFPNVPAYITDSVEFKVGLFEQAERYGLECTAVMNKAAYFKRIT